MMNKRKMANKKIYCIKNNITILFVLILSLLLISIVFLPVVCGQDLLIKTTDTKTVDDSKTVSSTEPTQITTPKETSTTTETTTPKETSTTTETTTEKTAIKEDDPTLDDAESISKTMNYSIITTNTTITENDTSDSSNNVIESYSINDTNSTINKVIIANVSVKTFADDSNDSSGVTVESIIGSINENTSISVSTTIENQSQSIIQEVDFTVSNNQENVKLTIKNLENKPDDVVNEINISHNKKLFKYVDIKLTANDTYIGETEINSMTFTFSIEKKWVESESIDMFSVQMLRYHNDSWQNLNTTFLYENQTHIFYQSETTGLSVFAVVGDTLVEDSESIVDGSTFVPWWIPFIAIIISTSALVFILVKKRYIYIN